MFPILVITFYFLKELYFDTYNQAILNVFCLNKGPFHLARNEVFVHLTLQSHEHNNEDVVFAW